MGGQKVASPGGGGETIGVGPHEGQELPSRGGEKTLGPGHGGGVCKSCV